MSGYRVKTVAELTGIPRNTLLAWERRYRLLSPDRTDSGYRLYSDDEVRYLQALKAHLDGGLSIGEAIRQVPRPGAEPPVAAPAPALRVRPPQELWQELLTPLLAFGREQAAPALRRLEQLPFEAAVVEVWGPLLAETGRAWEAGEITVAQEHFVSGVAREHLGAMFRSLGGGTGTGPRVALATLPDELHDIPALCLAVRLATWGWRVTWLGANLPIGDLCAYLVNQRPEVLALSSIAPDQPERVLEVARQLRSCAPTGTVVVLGGPGAAPFRGRSDERTWYCASADELRERWLARWRQGGGAAR